MDGSLPQTMTGYYYQNDSKDHNATYIQIQDDISLFKFLGHGPHIPKYVPGDFLQLIKVKIQVHSKLSEIAPGFMSRR